MLLIIPSIEIVNGKCKYTISGEQGTESFYQEVAFHPDLLCKLFRKENVKSIHITDYDSYKYDSYNFDIIFSLTKATFLPFQLQAKFSDFKFCTELLNNGIHRLVFDDINSYDIWDIKNLLLKFTNHRIIFNLPVIRDQIIFDNSSTYSLKDYLYQLHSIGADRVIFKQLDPEEGSYFNDNNLSIIKQYFHHITLSANIGDYRDLISFSNNPDIGFDSLILGEPLYENSFSCQKIWRLIESELDI